MNPFKDAETFANAFVDKLEKTYAVPFKESTPRQQYHTLGMLARERTGMPWLYTKHQLATEEHKAIHYFSMEFLMGRLITNNLYNLGIRDVVEKAFDSLGIDLGDIEHLEADAGLGNGGLGRLAACFLDSMASLGYPGYGNGIRYRYGLFEQTFEDGHQVELPDDWLKEQYVWEVRVEEDALDIPFGGEARFENGRAIYEPAELIKAVPYDIPVVGEENGVVNHLRLWNAEPTKVFPESMHGFEYNASLRQISGFLYPDDMTDEGKRLRIKQQYFFSAAGVRSLLKKHYARYKTFDNLNDLLVFQINDTHPALIIPEMMRVLLDEFALDYDTAWHITKNTCAYTNHTLMAEALETWPIQLFEPILPRIYLLIEEIDKRFRNTLKHKGYDESAIRELAIIEDGRIRMAHLAIVGSFSVNGVAALHTKLLKEAVMQPFDALYPNKFNNKTNGITHRRWLKHINPELSQMVFDSAGHTRLPEALESLEKIANNKDAQARFEAIKYKHKRALAKRIQKEQGIEIDPNSIFDVQIKRMHEYKRQLMNALHIMAIYHRLKTEPKFLETYVPHTFIFGAKAATGYHYAKKIIKLINTIAKKVNQDDTTNDYLKVVFVENYNVTYAEHIIPAADISEQISTATKEASGTGNMKFMMNGAITLGTLDGANVEIHERVGDENIEIFGMRADEVHALTEQGNYNPKAIYDANPLLKTVIDQLTNGFFDEVENDTFKAIRDDLLNRDQYYILKDFDAYKIAHERVNQMYQDRSKWLKAMLINIARSGYFSSDRTINAYAEEIWDVKPLI